MVNFVEGVIDLKRVLEDDLDIAPELSTFNAGELKIV